MPLALAPHSLLTQGCEPADIASQGHPGRVHLAGYLDHLGDRVTAADQ